VNERKTEDLVEARLRALGYYSPSSGIVVEKQKSDSPRIQRLLENASKKGGGCGKPEFLIHSKHHPDFLIVIECKADCGKHESAVRDRYAEYAVDGALLYGSYLSKEFDVLAIGVSGQTRSELMVSHFLYLRGVEAPHPMFGSRILPFDDYYSGYIADPQKFHQDYDKLLAYSRDLNELLHAKKVKESQRSLLISGILIALQNKAFEASFAKFTTAKQLAKHLVDTILDELSTSDLPQDKQGIIKQGFGFIETHATLSTDKEFFHELILGIDQHINSFRRTHLYFDTLGQFYIEFLRYANNDKGLGIVLTPPHITELFALLANVNKDSVVFDNTCGTSGFLISAMKQMVADAKGDSRKVGRIQKHQLIGVEYQDDIYALAVTNMVLHDDGKSNIYQGDCFVLGDTIRDKYRPNVGLLNPPYKTRRSDIEELQFVLNNLHVLQQGGVCVAIVPMSCILADSGVGMQLKRALLAEHTLEGVLSMPGELFHNSKVGVVTAALVVTAHVPHPKGKKTWFGYCRDDGFVKTKHRGRIDLYGKWQAIRDRWVQQFRNREVNPGQSVMRHVSPEEEWCAEAYMETDYSKITRLDFEDTVRRYAVFKLLGRAEQEAETDGEIG
jgi:type I restriction enzyme M protein